MGQRDLLRDLTLGQLLNAVGWVPLAGVTVGTALTVDNYGAGDRAIFWLLVTAFSGVWLSSNFRALQQGAIDAPRPPIPFSRKAIEHQERSLHEAEAELKELSDKLEPFGGKKINHEEHLELLRLNREWSYCAERVRNEARHRDLMYQANILVANGSEPLGAVVERVRGIWEAERQAALDRYLFSPEAVAERAASARDAGLERGQ